MVKRMMTKGKSKKHLDAANNRLDQMAKHSLNSSQHIKEDLEEDR